MHGSTYVGQCDGLLTGLASVIKENFDQGLSGFRATDVGG
jgi:hypothetical protein